jgi:hypothetical protein
VSWQIVTSKDGSCIVVAFDGWLSTAEGGASAAAFVEALRRGPADVVWDVRKMTGYDTGARLAWQQALWPLRRNIRGIEVLGGSPLVRLGALTLTTLLGVSVRFSGGEGKGGAR